MSQGQAASSQHVPPYTLLVGVNYIVGLNSVGLRRAPDITERDRAQIKEAYHLLYRSGLSTVQALVEMDARADWSAPAGRFRDFVRRVVTAEKPFNRGLASPFRAEHPADDNGD